MVVVFDGGSVGGRSSIRMILSWIELRMGLAASEATEGSNAKGKAVAKLQVVWRCYCG